MIKTNHILKAAAAVALTFSTVSCDDFFDLKPTNEMVLDQFWQKEEDVLSVTGSAYRAMQENDFLRRMIIWGEFRGDNVVRSPGNTDDNIRNIANLNILPANGFNSWEHYYTVINLCNTVIHFAPSVREVDPNFTQAQLNTYIAEAKGIRAYCYFTLVKTFRDVPFNEEAVVEDNQVEMHPQSDPDELLDFLIEDLKEIEPYAATTYGNLTYTKGRMTQAAIRTLIADMCLWRGRYDECVTYCDRVLNDHNNILSLESSLNFNRSVFVDGLSNETIFELEFSTVNYSNYALRDLYGSDNHTPNIVPYDFEAGGHALFSDTDLRKRTSYYASSAGTWMRKYVSYMSSTSLTADTYNLNSYMEVDPYASNWIIYRLPEVYLMKAEALAKLGTDLETAFNLACVTYDRANPDAGAGSLKYTDYASQSAVLDFIFEERQREFLYEGKRYFDILRRINHHRDLFRSIVDSYLAPKYDYLDGSTVTSKLSSMDALYMPIYSEELKYNTLLEQNPFYKTSTDITTN